MTTITLSTNNKTLAQLVEIARTLEVEVKLNQKVNLVRQREQVISALRNAGVRIQNTMAEKVM